MSDEIIAARFGGKDMTFRLSGEHCVIFEAVHGSLYDLYRRLVGGNWLIEDIRKVLEFSSFSDQQMTGMLQYLHPIGFIGEIFLPKPDPHIRATLFSRPVAPYAELALIIVGAALFGTKSEAERIFSDEQQDA